MTTTFMGETVVSEYKGDKIRNWFLNNTRKVDDIFGPYFIFQKTILEKQEQYLKRLGVPFITTVFNHQYRIWKEQKVEHVK